MIKLLSLIGSIGLATTGAIPLINNQINTNCEKPFETETKYWNQNHSKEEFTIITEGVNKLSDMKELSTLRTFHMGSVKPTFRHISFEGSRNGAAVKWGSTTAQHLFPSYIPFELKDDNNMKLEDEHDPSFYKFASIRLYYEKWHEGYAYCNSIVNYGWTWYEEDGEYYIQFLIQQFINTTFTFSHGVNSVDIGTGMTFFK